MSRKYLLPLMLLALFAGFITASAQTAQPKKASFRVKNLITIKVPAGSKQVRMWLAVPQTDAVTEVRNLNVKSDYPVQYREDSWGNQVGYLVANSPGKDQIVIEQTFEAARAEVLNKVDATMTRPLTQEERTALARYLQPSSYVVLNDDIKRVAASVVGSETNPVRATRKLYDWTYQNINYWVKDPDNLKASPVGDAAYCLTTKTGNCTDFHSLFSSLAIAAGIPNRMVYGSLFKPTLNGFDVDASYHCWIEFYAPRLGWVPLDASLANIYWSDTPLTDKNSTLIERTTSVGYKGPDAKMIEYYFGNLDERRVVWSRGRDLVMQPPQEDGPVNALHKIYVEVDGKELTDWTRVLTYSEM
jgi:transglutaminase-like putative cysteine protease